MSDNVQRATYYIGGKPVAYEKWSGDKRLPEILSQEELERDRDEYKRKREAVNYGEPGIPEGAGVIVTLVLSVLVTLAFIAWVLS